MTPSESQVGRVLERLDVSGEALLWRAPGRVNVIGEHVDYVGGVVLPFACDLDVLLGTEPLTGRVELISLDAAGEVAFDLDGDVPVEGWGRYAGGVLRALREAGIQARGFRGVVSSRVPVGAGLSSSAALEAVLALGFCDRPPPAAVLRRAEHLAVGVPCGLMDQVAVLEARAGHAIRLDCADERWEHVPIGDGIGFVVMDTGTRRALEDGRYAARRREAERAIAEAERTGATGDPRRLDAAAVRRLRLPEPLGRRLRHLVTEHVRTLEAVEVLRDGDARSLGELVGESHASLRYDFEVSAPELDTAVEAASSIPGCTGARLVGAGFAGCVLAITHREAATDVARALGSGASVVEAVDGAGPH